MAQLLSPVYTEPLKLHNPSPNLCYRSSWCMPKNSTPLNFATHNGKRRGCSRVRVAAEESFSTTDVADDYYAVLGLVMYHTLIFPSQKYSYMVKKIIDELSIVE